MLSEDREEEKESMDPLGRGCSNCGAAAGKPCVDVRLPWLHAERFGRGEEMARGASE